MERKDFLKRLKMASVFALFVLIVSVVSVFIFSVILNISLKELFIGKFLLANILLVCGICFLLGLFVFDTNEK